MPEKFKNSKPQRISNSIFSVYQISATYPIYFPDYRHDLQSKSVPTLVYLYSLIQMQANYLFLPPIMISNEILVL